MLMLSFESSAKAASVAVTEDGKLLGQSTQVSGLTHSATLLPMVEDLLKNLGLNMDKIDAFAVAHGPGSFTGIRIGISTVKGLGWAQNKPCTGVSTLEAMAWHGISAGGYVCSVMDARRSQIYNALFEIRDGKPFRLTPDRAISLEELAEEVKQLNAPVLLVGDGSVITKAFFDKVGIETVFPPENLMWQDAWGVAMAAGETVPGTSFSLLPVYLRLSQAERERQERLEKEKAEASGKQE